METIYLGLALNHDPPDLCLLSSKDYSMSHQYLALCNFLDQTAKFEETIMLARIWIILSTDVSLQLKVEDKTLEKKQHTHTQEVCLYLKNIEMDLRIYLV
jgi:hypothetical protein